MQKFQFSSTNCFVSEFVLVSDFSTIPTENQRKNLCLHSLCITIYQRTFVVSTSLTFQLNSRSSSLYSEVFDNLCDSYQTFIEESKNLMNCSADNFVGSRIVSSLIWKLAWPWPSGCPNYNSLSHHLKTCFTNFG